MALTKVEDPAGVFKNAVIKKAAMDWAFNAAGCALGTGVAIASAGASTPMAVAGCARMISSLVKFGATMADSYTKERHVPKSIMTFVAIQNECGSHRTPFAAAAAPHARHLSRRWSCMTPCNPLRRFVEAIDKVLKEHQKLNEGKEIGTEIAPMNNAAVNGITRFGCAVGAMSAYSKRFKVALPPPIAQPGHRLWCPPRTATLLAGLGR